MEEFNLSNMYYTLLYFMIYSFIGWVMESSFKSMLYKKCINSGFLNGPFIPIYGVGALVIIMFLSPFKGNNAMLFTLGFVFLSLLEYITGFVMEKMFETRWWDYTGNFMNFGGKICLENSIYWGIIAILLPNYIHPFVKNAVYSLPGFAGAVILTLFISYFILDYLITLIEVLDLQERVRAFVKIKDNAVILATTTKVSELRESIINNSSRLLNTYPRLTYIKMNRKLRDIVNEIKYKKN